MGPEAYEAFFDQFLTEFFTESDAAYLADLGTNAMRIPISYRHFESDEQPEGSHRSGPKAARPRRGHPGGSWHLLDHRPARGPWIPKPPLALRQPNALAAVWEYADLKERAIWLWEVLADHYKGNGWVAGFNLPNEPADEEGGRLIAWYSEAAHRVREIDADRMLFT